VRACVSVCVAARATVCTCVARTATRARWSVLLLLLPLLLSLNASRLHASRPLRYPLTM
jgi:hypothetical protein